MVTTFKKVASNRDAQTTGGLRLHPNRFSHLYIARLGDHTGSRLCGKLAIERNGSGLRASYAAGKPLPESEYNRTSPSF